MIVQLTDEKHGYYSFSTALPYSVALDALRTAARGLGIPLESYPSEKPIKQEELK